MVLKRSQTGRGRSMNISYEVATGHCISLPFETLTKANVKTSQCYVDCESQFVQPQKRKATSQTLTKVEKEIAEITFKEFLLLLRLSDLKTSRAMRVSAEGHVKRQLHKELRFNKMEQETKTLDNRYSWICKDCLFITDELSRRPNFCPECGHKFTVILTSEMDEQLGIKDERRKTL